MPYISFFNNGVRSSWNLQIKDLIKKKKAENERNWISDAIFGVEDPNSTLFETYSRRVSETVLSAKWWNDSLGIDDGENSSAPSTSWEYRVYFDPSSTGSIKLTDFTESEHEDPDVLRERARQQFKQVKYAYLFASIDEPKFSVVNSVHIVTIFTAEGARCLLERCIQSRALQLSEQFMKKITPLNDRLRHWISSLQCLLLSNCDAEEGENFAPRGGLHLLPPPPCLVPQP